MLNEGQLGTNSKQILNRSGESVPNKLIGQANECFVSIDGIRTSALLDTGSMVSSISETFWKNNLNSELHPMSELLTIHGAGGHCLPYLGYIESSFQIYGSNNSENSYPFLIVPDTIYNSSTPVLVGTNILKPIRDDLIRSLGVQFIQKSDLPISLQVALRTIVIQERHMRRSNGVFGVVKMDSVTVVPGQKSMFVEGFTRLTIPVSSRVAYLQPVSNLPAGIEITPGLVSMDNNMHKVNFEICNHSSQPIRLQSGAIVCELQETSVEDPETQDLSRHQFLQQFPLEGLDEHQTKVVETLLWNWRRVFSHGSFDIGCTDICRHRIDLNDEIPFKDRCRRIPPSMFEEVRKHLKEMLDIGVIEESNSPWSSNIVLVRKKDGSLRFCMDYRKLNRRTIRDCFELPRIEEILDVLKGSSWFSTLDLCSGYWQMKVEEEHKERTAFSAGPLGFYQFKCMLFGLTNAPSSFQRLMQEVLGELHLKISVAFLDDVNVFANSFENQCVNLEKVFQKLLVANLKLKPSKCKFFKRKLVYVGHTVSEEGIQCNKEHIEAIINYPIPTNVDELRRFLGLASY
jgi:hypothetical protein